MNYYEFLISGLRYCAANHESHCFEPPGCPMKHKVGCVDAIKIAAADAIEHLIEERDAAYLAGHQIADKLPVWISVEERLPEEEESVFVVRKFLGVKGQVPPSTYTEIAYRIGDRWVADSDEYKIARHRHTDPLFWMPLPEPPMEDDA